MSELYDWQLMPPQLTIHCPRCSQAAQFTFAKVVSISQKAHITYFEKHPLFSYHKVADVNGQTHHLAFYYDSLGSVQQDSLPHGYQTNDWAYSSYTYDIHQLSLGGMRCYHCHAFQKHKLDWPNDAFYSITYQQQMLWAYDDESCRALRHYIASNSREIKPSKWASYLLHIPRIFKSRHARTDIVKQLDKRLNANTT